MTRKPKVIRKLVFIAMLLAFTAGSTGPLYAQSPREADSRTVVALLKEQNRELSKDLRRIQREIAALRADLNKPGLEEVFAGIGYIFGLFGVAAIVAARRKE